MDECFLRQFGPRLPSLPWSGASGALSALSANEGVVLSTAQRALRESWLTEPMTGMVSALTSAVPGTVVAHGGARSRLPTWVVHDAQGRVSTDPRQLVGETEGPHFGKARLMAYFGVYRPEGDCAFSLSEHALLHALVPDLRRWFCTARLLGVQPLHQTGVLVALEANGRPACLVREDGVLVFANQAARALDPELLRLAAAGQHAESDQLSMMIQAERFQLVLLPVPEAPPEAALAAAPPEATLEQLPLSLQRVARSLAEGHSDKEIAAQLELSLATVRTYAVRVYRRLGVSSRRELMRLCGR